MRPFKTEKGCLKCHAQQGYREGDIRGGISVSTPLAPLYAAQQRTPFNISLGHGLWWLVGIGLGRRRLTTAWQQQKHAEAALRRSNHRLKDQEEALRERMKELTCFYAVSRDMQEDLSIDELCRRAVDHLVPAMQFPEITVPVIELNGKRVTSENYTEGLSHGLHAEIRIKGEPLCTWGSIMRRRGPF
jgi:hypothetical protein